MSGIVLPLVFLALDWCVPLQPAAATAPDLASAATAPIGVQDRRPEVRVPEDPVSGDGATDDDAARFEGVVGTVRDGSGRPLAGVLVQARATSGTSPAPDLAVVTDQGGRFSWPLAPGTYRMVAGPGGEGLDVTVRTGQATQVDLTAR